MLHKLPKEINPLRFAHNGLTLEGTLLLATMSRLTQSLQNSDGLVNVAMRFDIDESGVPYIFGHFKASVSILCERCIKTMQFDIDASCLLAMVTSENQVADLTDKYEPWVLESSNVVLSKVIEDELILSLPLVAKHEYMCLSDNIWSTGDTQTDTTVVESPFAVLATLKTQE